MVDLLPAVVRDVALEVAGRVVNLARDDGVTTGGKKAGDRRADDEVGEVAHSGRLTWGVSCRFGNYIKLCPPDEKAAGGAACKHLLGGNSPNFGIKHALKGKVYFKI